VGASERSYGTLLQRLADDLSGLHVYLDLQDLRGGDPLAIVETACRKAKERARNHGAFIREKSITEGFAGKTPQSVSSGLVGRRARTV
jgi:hypothetical protein